MKLSIIIVTYNDCNYLRRCTDSIYGKLEGFLDWEIIIVNNDKNQDVRNLSLDFSKIKLVDHRENGGFGSGINLGAKKAKGEFLLILNPDTEMIMDNIQDVLNKFSEDKVLGIIGGGIIDRKGKKQEWSAGRELSLYDLVRNNLGISRSRFIWDSNNSMECDWVAGTVMFIERKVFNQLGGFDERFFMYFEDMDLCRRVRKSGKKVMFFPEMQVFHGNGKSYEDKRLQKKHYYDSMEQYFGKKHGQMSRMLVKLVRNIIIRK